MSHFTVLALFRNANPSNLEIAAAFAPFDESMEVEPYEERCYCVGGLARERAHELADIAEGSYDDLRAQFATIIPGQDWDEKQRQVEWEKLIEKRIKVEQELFETDLEKDNAIADCKECHGTGTCMSTYNPNSKWDWYAEGGRWDAGERNRGTVASILDGSNPVQSSFAVLTPDGEWIEQGNMRWFGIVSDEKSETDWNGLFRSTLEQFKDCFYILIDAHI